jgi:hypothetical protein
MSRSPLTAVADHPPAPSSADDAVLPALWRRLPAVIRARRRGEPLAADDEIEEYVRRRLYEPRS